MNAQTREALNAINRAFYQREAEDFSQTRNHAWPGWPRLLERCRGREPLRVLDVGCGNARFASFLQARLQRPLAYVGVDASKALLEIARSKVPSATFHLFDLVCQGPEALPHGPFDLITLFGVTHHIPGERERGQLLAALAERLASEGLLAFSVWQFASDPRFARHGLPWQGVPIDEAQLEPGDHLLRWGDGDATPRYCHDSSPAELERLLAGLDLELVDDYRADGRSGELNRYLILRRPRVSQGERPGPS